MQSVGTPLYWALFIGIVVSALAIDLGVVHRGAHKVKAKEAALWVGIWVTLAASFNAFVYLKLGKDRGLEFTQAWLLEYALSIDNVFVFIIIFAYFKVPDEYQHRVLFWGIIGAVVTRGAFVGLGAVIISRFHWVMYLLGAFLVYTAFRLLTQKDEHMDPSANPVLRLFRRFVPTADNYDGAKFFTMENGIRKATPLLAVLVVVEGTDVVFAVDSIPACFGVTKDVFIVYTSNIFAILGLRSLFFMIADLMSALAYLKTGVAIILGFIGVKILIEKWWHMPIGVSLGVLAGVLTISVVVSLLFPPKGAGEVPHPGPSPE